MQGNGSVEWKGRNHNTGDDINERGNSWMCIICSKLQLVFLPIKNRKRK